jgi:hypothetical protein
MRKGDIQDLIDRLEALKKRQAGLIDVQHVLDLKLAEAAAQNELAREYLIAELDKVRRERADRKQSRRSGG